MKQGDTIQGLAVKYYGAAKYAPLILNANKQFGDPKKIPIGAKITIPPAPPAETPKAGVASGTPTTRPSTEARAASGEPRRQPPNTKPYVVKKGENWRRIAADVMGDGSKWTELFEMNKRSPNESPQTLHAGETIYVPTTAAAGTPPTRTLMSTTPKP